RSSRRNCSRVLSFASPRSQTAAPRSATIVLRRRPHEPLEHGREGGRARIAEVEGNRCHPLAAHQPWQRGQQAGAPLPGREGEAGLTQEEPGERASAESELAAPQLDRVLGARALEEAPAPNRELVVKGQRQAER